MTHDDNYDDGDDDGLSEEEYYQAMEDHTIGLLVDGYRSTMESISNKILWDIVFHMINPDEKTRVKLLTEIKSIAVKEIRHTLGDFSSELSSDQLANATERIDTAIGIAMEKFTSLYSHTLLDHNMMDSMVHNIHVNLPLFKPKPKPKPPNKPTN